MVGFDLGFLCLFFFCGVGFLLLFGGLFSVLFFFIKKKKKENSG